MKIKPHQLQHVANGERRIKEAARIAKQIWDVPLNIKPGIPTPGQLIEFERLFDPWYPSAYLKC